MIEIIDYKPEFAGDFKRINEQWITNMFSLEATDRAMLNDPQRFIIESGGAIYFARHAEWGIVGTCALLKQAPGVFELTKMGVLESARGLNVGETLLQHTLQQAQSLAADCLFLLTNKKCRAAIHLYLKHGFEHDAEIMQTYAQEYQRCDVAMRYRRPLTASGSVPGK